MKRFIIILIVVLLVGCATSSRMNKVNIGMSKSEILSVMGTPTSKSAEGNKEVLKYKLYGGGKGVMSPRIYHIVLENDKVVSFGDE